MIRKYIFTAFTAVATLPILASCAKENAPALENIDPKVNAEQITISATLADALTKVSFNPSYTNNKPAGMALTWAEGDALRVYDHADRSRYDDFTIEASSVGTKTGSFTGTLVNASSATSYDVEVIGGAGFNYAVQTQPSDGATTGLKYIASASNVADLSSITLTDLSSVLAITAKMPSTDVAATIKSVDITASNAIFNVGKTLSITFDAAGDAGEDGILHFFATLPQGNTAVPNGTTLLVHFNAPGEDHDIYTRFITLGSQTFTAGKLNAININASESDTHAGATSCDGTTAEKAYLLGDKYQMQAMRDLMPENAQTYFKMVDDIDLDGVNWKPLNYNNSFLREVFFDGGKHTINKLTCGSSYGYPSFVGVLKGTVKNVTFANAEITCGANKGGVVAGYIGHKSTSKLGNCIDITIDNAKITSTNIAGILGAQGDYLGTISGCSVSNSSISSTANQVGGLIAYIKNDYDTIGDCKVESTSVESTYTATDPVSSVGGLIGKVAASGTISKCKINGGLCQAHSYVGGLCGDVTAATTISNSSAQSVAVSGDNYYVGGLVGHMTGAGEISGCHTSGTIIANGGYSRAGGIVGQLDNGNIINSYSSANVIYKGHYAGGLVGVVNAGANIEISKCYATGNVGYVGENPSKSGIGGFIGDIESSTGKSISVSNCYNTGSVSGYRWGGAFIGRIQTGVLDVHYCYTNSALDFSNANMGVFIGNAATLTTVTYDHIIAWNTSNKPHFIFNTNVDAAPEGNYFGAEGSISTIATGLGFDGSIWDLTVNPPTLKQNN